MDEVKVITLINRNIYTSDLIVDTNESNDKSTKRKVLESVSKNSLNRSRKNPFNRENNISMNPCIKNE